MRAASAAAAWGAPAGAAGGAGAPGTLAPWTLLTALLAFSALLYGVDAESCYWCGPAAEQVHRSRRPPPCRAPFDPLQSDRCDAAQNCATVAVSPPYVESRICISHHQEECTTRFCNRSQTWRVTCTCQGELCNGENDPRVLEAFARITQLNVSAPSPEEVDKIPRLNVSDPTPELIMKVTGTSGLVDGTSGATHEYHNAHEMSSLWTTSSESETVEQLPSAAPLRGGAGAGGGGESGGGEDDEDAGEGSGAALRSDQRTSSDTVHPSTERSARHSTDAPLEHHASSAPAAAAAMRLTSLALILAIA